MASPILQVEVVSVARSHSNSLNTSSTAPPKRSAQCVLFSFSSYACSRAGHIFEIDYRKVSISRVRRLMPSGVKPPQQQQQQQQRQQTGGKSGATAAAAAAAGEYAQHLVDRITPWMSLCVCHIQTPHMCEQNSSIKIVMLLSSDKVAVMLQ